jgi:hypothetical protein
MEVKYHEFAMGISFGKVTEEEKLWIERIERNRLWCRYVPEHVKQNDLIWDIIECAPLRLEEMFRNFGYDKDFKDKRTRNEKGQEKHESRKCEHCGK